MASVDRRYLATLLFSSEAIALYYKLASGSLLVAVMAIIIFLVIYEARSFGRGNTVVDIKQFICRMTEAFILIVLLAMIFSGLILINFKHPLDQLIYWCKLAGLLIVLFIILFFDVRLVLRKGLKKKREIYKSLIHDTLRQQTANHKSDSMNDTSGKPA